MVTEIVKRSKCYYCGAKKYRAFMERQEYYGRGFHWYCLDNKRCLARAEVYQHHGNTKT